MLYSVGKIAVGIILIGVAFRFTKGLIRGLINLVLIAGVIAVVLGWI